MPKHGEFLVFLWIPSADSTVCSSAEIVRWVTENLRPFQIVKDRAFVSLMKTGRPEYYIPSPQTVSWDVKQVFVRTRQRIAKMLKVSVDVQCYRS